VCTYEYLFPYILINEYIMKNTKHETFLLYHVGCLTSRVRNRIQTRTWNQNVNAKHDIYINYRTNAADYI